MSMQPAGLVTTNPQLSSLVDFRAGFYQCLTRWPDAGFELVDAVLCSPSPVASIPALSLEPASGRSHGSLYKALARGEVDAEAMRDLLVAHRPNDWPLVFAVDASTWARCDAETSPERGFYYSASTHSAGKPIVAGWSYQWITQLDWAHNSWTAPMDVTRIAPTQDGIDVTTGQIRDLVGRLGPTEQMPLFVFDAGYDAPALTDTLTGVDANIVIRIRDDRVFYTDPQDSGGTHTGRPRRHGQRRTCSEPDTWPAPDEVSVSTDPRYGTVRASAWHDLHPRLGCRGHWANHDVPPIVTGTIIRVDVEHLPKPLGTVKKTLWLWAAGPVIDLQTCWAGYLRRFDIEHTFRFIKNTLGWTAPALCTPEQADRWTWLIAAAYTQLRLARPIVEDIGLPWERRRKPGRLTPARVRRGFRRLTPILDTPASPPKPSKPGPGRPKGTRRERRTRHPAIKKAT